MRPVCLNWDVQVERSIRQWYNIWDVDAASRRRTTYFDIKSVVFRVITRRRVVIIYRRFGTTYRSHPHGSRFRES
jgi:hypothetical protein